MTRHHPDGEKNPYAVLAIQPDATSSAVRLAYLQKLREHPPERDPEGFKRVREAYETLRSPRKRAEIALLELRQGPTEFDLDRLLDAPPPPFPQRYLDDLIAIAFIEIDAAIDAQVAASLASEHPARRDSRGDEGGA